MGELTRQAAAAGTEGGAQQELQQSSSPVAGREATREQSLQTAEVALESPAAENVMRAVEEQQLQERYLAELATPHLTPPQAVEEAPQEITPSSFPGSVSPFSDLFPGPSPAATSVAAAGLPWFSLLRRDDVAKASGQGGNETSPPPNIDLVSPRESTDGADKGQGVLGATLAFEGLEAAASWAVSGLSAWRRELEKALGEAQRWAEGMREAANRAAMDPDGRPSWTFIKIAGGAALLAALSAGWILGWICRGQALASSASSAQGPHLEALRLTMGHLAHLSNLLSGCENMSSSSSYGLSAMAGPPHHLQPAVADFTRLIFIH